MEGFEADDLIATYAKKAESAGHRVTIVSADKDFCQLVTENVSLFDPQKEVLIRKEQVIEKYELEPEKMIDFQALVGDKSDNGFFTFFFFC